jgi:hypothetical protein
MACAGRLADKRRGLSAPSAQAPHPRGYFCNVKGEGEVGGSGGVHVGTV